MFVSGGGMDEEGLWLEGEGWDVKEMKWLSYKFHKLKLEVWFFV